MYVSDLAFLKPDLRLIYIHFYDGLGLASFFVFVDECSLRQEPL